MTKRPHTPLQRLGSTLLITVLLLGTWGLFQFSGVAGDDPGAGTGNDHLLTVINGYGSGKYHVGETVHVWAKLQPLFELLTSWQGDADLLKRPREWHTTLVMPAKDVTVEANVEARDEKFENWQYRGTTARNKAVISYFPNQPRGLLLMLHGTGGSASIIEKPEPHYIALAAIARGWAVLSTEAEEVVAGDLDHNGKLRWDAAISTRNVDLANLDRLLATLIERGDIPAGLPLAVVGMSNGGAMAVTLAGVQASPAASLYPNLHFVAAISYCASGRSGVSRFSTTPTAWLLCANDDSENVSNDLAKENKAALQARGVATLIEEHAGSPLYDARFERVENVDSATSKAMAAELRVGNFVGFDGFFVVSSHGISAAIEAKPGAFPVILGLSSRSRRLAINQIRVMQAEHQMFSDWANFSIDFIEQNL